MKEIKKLKQENREIYNKGKDQERKERHNE
jgi:hypothetical protein